MTHKIELGRQLNAVSSSLNGLVWGQAISPTLLVWGSGSLSEASLLGSCGAHGHQEMAGNNARRHQKAQDLNKSKSPGEEIPKATCRYTWQPSELQMPNWTNEIEKKDDKKKERKCSQLYFSQT